MFKDPLQTCLNMYKKPTLGTIVSDFFPFYTLSPSLKNPESMNIHVFVIPMVFLLGANCLLLTVKFILSVCILRASSLHITLVLAKYWTWIGLYVICVVTNHNVVGLPS